MSARQTKIARVIAWGIVVGFGLITYVTSYFASTSLTIGMPMLDWYATRTFDSRGHFLFYYPMYAWESAYDRSNPGYVLRVDTRGTR